MKILWISFLALAITTPARAADWFDAVFDTNRPITIMGEVTKMEWANPHVNLFARKEPNAAGAITLSAGALRSSFAPGEYHHSFAQTPAAPGQRGETAPAPQRALGQPFELKGGETALLENGNLTVAFEKVASDSRCPIDVTCIWEGDAAITLRLKKTNRDALSVEIHTSSRFAREAAYEGYRVSLQGLKPQPRANTPIDQKAYTATLVISRAD